MVYAFGDCELDTQRITLHRAGQPTHLTPKVFQVLMYLLTHRDRVVNKQELCAQVWPGQFISDATLESTLRAVRRAVGDSGKLQRIIQTLHGHGYHFAAPVTVRDAPQQGDATTVSPGLPPSAEAAPRDPVETAPVPVVAPPQEGTPVPLLADPNAPEAERRQLTVMFCDLVDSTALAGSLDPEDFYDVVRAYQEACAGVIARFDGHIAQYLGDGLLIYFGYPLAHEDDARRAVQAGLGIVAALKPLQARLAQASGVHLAVRIGIHTGMVVVGSIGTGARQERLALGETPNIAARLQGLARPDTLVISAVTAQLVHGFFTCQLLETPRLKGLSQSMTVYRVLGATGAQSRLDVVDQRGLTPLVGRQAEVALLLERWAQVRDGLGHVMVLSGEAGIGKSRLAQVLQDHLGEATVVRLECRCSPYYQHSAWYPLLELLQRLFQWQPDDTSDEKWRKLVVCLTHHGLPVDETAALFAALLSLPCTEARYALPPLTPQQQRRKTVEAMLALLLALAARHPVLLMVEDLHWVDPSTLEVLTLLVEHIPTLSLYLVVTCRPTLPVPWSQSASLTHITLPRLPQAQVEQMVTSLARGKALPSEVLRRVVDETDGVPLFVEEVTKAVLETGVFHDAADRYEFTATLPAVTIPPSLYGSLMARLDRLGPAKGVAQLGAVVGRQVPYTLLQAVAQQDDASLGRALGQLVEAGLMYQRGLPPQTTYMFKHALVQETAYQSLVKPTRQRYHQHVAQALGAQFPEIVAMQPELLAHHYTEAGLAEQAVPYWLRAGERATERSANVEAISHLTKGLELLKTLPETLARAQHELALQLALGSPLLMIKGQAAPEVEQVYIRALELCQQTGNHAQHFAALMGLRRFYISAGRLQTTREISEESLALAQRLGDQALLWEAHLALGATLFYLGELTSARLHLEQGLGLYAPEQSHFQVFSGGAHPQPFGLSFAAWTLWLLGYPDAALRQSQEALALARQLAHPYILARALYYAASVHQFRHEALLVQKYAEDVMAVSHEHGFTRWLGRGMVMRGWALVELGATDEGIAQLRQGVTVCGTMADELGRPVFFTSLAEAYGKAGQPEAGLQALEEALVVAHKTGERRWEAESYRLKGELLLLSTGRRRDARTSRRHAPRRTAALADAEACLQHAIAVAGQQQAKSLELRAVMSLSRLWQSQEKRREAHQLLAGVYGWFSEGFETLDLQDAQALLAALR